MPEPDVLRNDDVKSCRKTITVILCTYNRCQSLSKALQSVALSDMPVSAAWEILVVDNNSHDQTREVVANFSRRQPGRFRYLFESNPGKSHALNAGIREAHGDILVFIDDDVTVEKNWLHNLTAALDGDAWAGAGGRILPEEAFSPPPWLPLEGPNNMGGILALFDLGETAAKLDQPPFGTNMAYQRKMFERHGGFRVDLGPRPGSELRNEDTEFGRRLLTAGERLRYEPSAVVYHSVPADRLKREYFLRFCFDHGRAIIRETGKRPNVWGIPRRYLTLLKIVTLLAGRSLRWVWTFWNSRLRFHHKAMAWGTAGQIMEIWLQLRSGERQSENAMQMAKKEIRP